MALNNSLSKSTNTKPKEHGVTFEVNGLQVNLTPQIVRDYLVSGDKERVTIQEVSMFINLCKFSQLNPWLKEAYCIKYGNEPATMVVGKEAFQKRAENHPAFDGYEAGIIVLNEDGIVYRNGCVKLPGEEIIGGYAEVWRKDKNHSYRAEVSFDEYAGRKKDGSLNSQWGKKPATMIRKVALVQALREAFPQALGGMYTAEEQGYAEAETTAANVIQVDEPPVIIEQPEEKTESSVNDAQAALFGGR